MHRNEKIKTWKITYKDYLNKTFLEELNYKIWSTKGSRFNASHFASASVSLVNAI
ncbi:hypothetical protein GCM10022423_23830 [Flavobacterium ginsengiterrae]|uniref:Uncharacterized protein n=1 Tax=Flavobacterium ginsengiterrae TaxID=871695 RepID=A0ABP7GN04_9FLAO